MNYRKEFKEHMQKTKEYVKKNIRWIILLVGLIIFFLILEDLFENEIDSFDSAIYQIISYVMSDRVTSLMKVITNLGGAVMIVSITILVLLFSKKKKMNLCVIANLAIITISNQLLKRIIARPRPVEHRLIGESGYSFPSGHSMVSMAFYGLLIYYAYKNIKKVWVRNTVCILLATIIVLIGMSRIYLGVHYPSDVLAGFCISLSYLALFTNVTKKYSNESEELSEQIKEKGE